MAASSRLAFNVGDRILTGLGATGLVISLKQPGIEKHRLWYQDISTRAILHTDANKAKLLNPAESNEDVIEAMEIARKKKI